MIWKKSKLKKIKKFLIKILPDSLIKIIQEQRELKY
jgi:hypothetical protein